MKGGLDPEASARERQEVPKDSPIDMATSATDDVDSYEGFPPLDDTTIMDEGLMPLDDYDTEAHCGKPFP